MLEVGDFIGNYRILAQLSRYPTSSLYVVEHTYTPLGPALLLFYHTVTVASEEEQHVFLNEVRTGTIQQNVQTIAFQDAVVVNQHPYLIAAYNNETQNALQDHMKLIEQILQSTQSQHPNDQHVLFDAFLLTFVRSVGARGGTSSASTNQSTDASNKPSQTSNRGSRRSFRGKRQIKKWQVGVVLAILVALVVGSGSFLYTIIPAATATVTITPVKKEFTQMYDLTVVAGSSTDPLTVQGRQLSATSQPHVSTVTATGQGVHEATLATGFIVLSQIQLTTTGAVTNSLAISSISDANGITITTDQEVPISDGATVTIPAHATTAGSVGNIRAYDMDRQIQIVDALTNAVIGTGFITNPIAFTGGSAAIQYTFVQQSDIDAVTKNVTDQFTPDTQKNVQSQIQGNELPLQNIQYTSNTSSNHNANDEVNNVTVTVSITCSILVYTEQAIDDTAISVYQNQGSVQFGSDYGIVGVMRTSKPFLSHDNVFTVGVDAIWSFQYTPSHLQEIKRLIAGETSRDALQLLHERDDIQHVTLATTGGIGSAVPTKLDDIRLVVAKIDGLHA